MGLFALVSLALLGVFLSSRRADRAGLVNAQAAVAAQAELSRLRTRPRTVLEAYVADPPSPYNVTACGMPFEVRARVAPLPGEPALLDLSVELGWDQARSLAGTEAGALLKASRVRQVMHTVVAP